MVNRYFLAINTHLTLTKSKKQKNYTYTHTYMCMWTHMHFYSVDLSGDIYLYQSSQIFEKKCLLAR